MSAMARDHAVGPRWPSLRGLWSRRWRVPREPSLCVIARRLLGPGRAGPPWYSRTALV